MRPHYYIPPQQLQPVPEHPPTGSQRQRNACGCCRNASVTAVVAFGFAVAGTLLHMFGFYTVGWAVEEQLLPPPHDIWGSWNYGLWQRCWATSWINKCEGYPYLSGWLKATQAFEVIGFIAAVVALILIVLYIFVPATSGKRIVFILSILACFAAAGCILLGIIIYGSEVRNLSWSFALCCIAGIIFAISGILLVVDMCKR